MNNLCCDFIVIDTNVFLHLFNVQNNNDGHIDELLKTLMGDSIGLLVDLIDNHSWIAAEYKEKLSAKIHNSVDTTEKTQILRYWIAYAKRETVQLDKKGDLMKAVRSIIREPMEHADRAFVCVAFQYGRPLITNDRIHILWGSQSERPTRKKNRSTYLFATTKKWRAKGAAVFSSQCAHASL